MRAKLISEKFSEETDPIADLDIGGIVLQPEFRDRKNKLEKDIFNLEVKAKKDWERYLRKLLIGKTITADMQRLASYSSKDMTQKTKSEYGKFTIKVIDIKVEDLKNEYNNYLIIADDEGYVYNLKMTDKFRIHR